jgi:hypothetical protein
LAIKYRFDPKHPSDIDFFTWDWTAFLPIGVAIVSYSFVNVYYNVNGSVGGAADITQPSAPQLSGNLQTAMLAGGTLNTDYIVSFSITRSDGADDTRSAFLYVGQV